MGLDTGTMNVVALVIVCMVMACAGVATSVMCWYIVKQCCGWDQPPRNYDGRIPDRESRSPSSSSSEGAIRPRSTGSTWMADGDTEGHREGLPDQAPVPAPQPETHTVVEVVCQPHPSINLPS